MSNNTSTDVPAPPVAKRIPHTSSHWGDTRVDHYKWLEDRSSAEVLELLESENAYTEAVMAEVDDVRETLRTGIEQKPFVELPLPPAFATCTSPSASTPSTASPPTSPSPRARSPKFSFRCHGVH